MSKLMIVFVLLVSGSLYDPQRVIHQLGPEASAIGWKAGRSPAPCGCAERERAPVFLWA